MHSVHYLTILLIAGLMVAPFTAVAAGGSIGITILPTKHVIDADPGDVVTKHITVVNPNDFVLKARAEFQDFKVTPDNNIQWVPNDVENPFSMRKWINLSQEVITLDPGGEFTIPVTIRVPNNASPGGHYAAVFFTAVLGDGGGDIGSVPRVGSLLIVNVAGDLERTGELTGFSAPLVAFGGPVTFRFNFLNTGTTHYENKGEVAIWNALFQKTVLTSEKRFLYPQIEREITAVWDNTTPVGPYLVQAMMEDGEGNSYTKTRIMVGVPLKIIVPVLTLVLLLWWGWRTFRRKFKLVRAE